MLLVRMTTCLVSSSLNFDNLLSTAIWVLSLVFLLSGWFGLDVLKPLGDRVWNISWLVVWGALAGIRGSKLYLMLRG